MFLQQAVQGRTSGSAIQPQSDFIRGIDIVGRKEPEVELILVRAIAINRQGAGI